MPDRSWDWLYEIVAKEKGPTVGKAVVNILEMLTRDLGALIDQINLLHSERMDLIQEIAHLSIQTDEGAESASQRGSSNG